MSEAPADAEDTKVCPFCAETIKSAAIVCRYCGHRLDGTGDEPAQEATEPQEKPEKSVPTSWGCCFVILVVVVIIMASMCNSSSVNRPSSGSDSTASTTPAKDYGDATSAYVMAQEFVTKRLKSPGSAKYPWSNEATMDDLGGGKWKVRGYVDSQNSFGALVRSDFIVKLHKDPNSDNWGLDDISLETRQ